MIVPLKRVTVVCVDSARSVTLETLRELGVMHLVPLRTPTGEALEKVRKQLSHVKKALEAVPAGAVGAAAANIAHPVDEAHAVLAQQKHCEETIAHVKAELARFKAFGNFDPAQLLALANKGVQVKLYECDEKVFKIPAGECSVVEFRRDGGTVSFAVVGQTATDIGLPEIRLPERSIAAMKAEQESCQKILAECEKRLAALAHQRAEMENELGLAKDDFHLEEAGAGMLCNSGVSLIQGYCPDESIGKLRALAPQMGWGIRIDYPTDEEDVPTLLKHPKLVKPIETLYGLIGITPGYRELDTSAVFLLFFSIFFAMIVGDAGYGVILLGLTLWTSKKFKTAPREIFQFLGLMSVVTVLWGVVNASYFGISAKNLPAFIDLARASYTPAPLRSAVSWIRDEENLKYFCFVLGVVHLTIAHVWNFWVNRKSSVCLAQLGWLCTTWTMFFLAGTMVISKPFPPFAGYLGIFGTVLILFFSVPPSKLKEGWFDLVMLPLNLVSNFVDVISYIRLFAVGMAGFAVANSFNEMVSPLFGSVLGSLLAVIILFLAHGLNLVLAAMGVAVHAVRLNTLEFSNHIGLQWSGYAYAPFRKHKA